MKNITHEGAQLLALVLVAMLAFAACAAAAVLVGRIAAPSVTFLTPGAEHVAQASVAAKR